MGQVSTTLTYLTWLSSDPIFLRTVGMVLEVKDMLQFFSAWIQKFMNIFVLSPKSEVTDPDLDPDPDQNSKL